LQRVDLFGDKQAEGAERLVASVLRTLSNRRSVGGFLPARGCLPA
jgi:hypothetical protein